MFCAYLPVEAHFKLTYTIERRFAGPSVVILRLKGDTQRHFPYSNASPFVGLSVDILDKAKRPLTGIWARVVDPAPITEAAFQWLKANGSPRWSFVWNKYFAIASDRDGRLGKVVHAWMSIRL